MKARRFISNVLALIMMWSIVTVIAVPSNAADYYCTKTLEELKLMFPENRYWNHVGLSSWDMTTTTDQPCTTTHTHGNCRYSGSCGCNSYKGVAIQCMGFSYALQSICFNGYDGYYGYENRDYTNAMANLKAGDVIRYYKGSYKHSIFVTKVDGDTIYYMDCNGTGGGCIIRHDETITKSSLKAAFIYTSPAPCELTSNAANRVKLYETATVTAKNGLIIRSSPDINSSKVGILKYGETVDVCHFPIQDRSGYTWRKLMNGTGWVCRDYLNIIDGQIVADGTYKIQNTNGKFLTYVSAPANDVNIIMLSDLSGTASSDAQLWDFLWLGACPDTGAALYRIKPILNANYSLDCDATNNQLLHLWKSLDIGAQQWILEVRSDGSIRIVNMATKNVLDIEGCNDSDYAEVICYPSNDGWNQTFYLVNP